MKIVADTNLLLRLIMKDDPAQTRTAVETLEQAPSVIIGLYTLSELVWVLRSRYGATRKDTAAALRQLLQTRNFEFDFAGVEAGLYMLENGGDFADGVIAYDGLRLGGETFVSFDSKAIKLLKEQGHATKLLK